jgi:hypothetical protein
MKVINLKDLAKQKSKDFFRSKGYSTIKRSFINEKGEQEEEFIKIVIYPVGSHPVIKKHLEENKPPRPPITREFLDRNGKVPTSKEQGSWCNVFDYTDEEYTKAKEEYEHNLRLLQLMIVFDMIEDYGVEKIKDFEEFLEGLGLTPNQLNKIGEDIKNLDFFTETK